MLIIPHFIPWFFSPPPYTTAITIPDFALGKFVSQGAFQEGITAQKWAFPYSLAYRYPPVLPLVS
jgi:hypothetical protein